MGKLFFFIAFLSTTTIAFSKDESDSTKYPLTISGDLSINSNGIAPIPAFALGKPAIIANLSLRKGRFSYDPMLAYSLELKPWIIDNWFHYQIVDNSRFNLKTGINVSMFFSEYSTQAETFLQGQRYFAFELTGKYKTTNTSSLSLSVWLDDGVDPGTVKGYFLNLVADKWGIPIGKHVLMAINLQLFYIDYTENMDGMFISPKISFSTRDIPFKIFGQGIQPLFSNIDPFPEFQWNIGLGYSF